MTLQQNSVKPITSIFESNFKTVSQKWSPNWDDMLPEHLCRYLEGQGHSITLQQNQVRPLTCYLKLHLTIISQRWSPYWICVSHAAFGWLPWRLTSQHDLAAKLCPAHKFYIWSWILQLFHRNDHHIEMTCHMQHLGCYLEGQCHSITLHQNCVQPITTLFEVGFYNFFT
jgi:hypothetical protein